MSNNAELTPYREPRPRPRLARYALPLAVCVASAATAAAVALAASSNGKSVPAHPQMTNMLMGTPQPGGHAAPWDYGTPQAGGTPQSGNAAPQEMSAPTGGDFAKSLGSRLAGNGQEAVSLATAKNLGNQQPAGAQVDSATNTVRFTTRQVSLVVLASPPEADMKFRAAGLNDPTIEVPANAQVTVRFINADKDMAHMWLLQSANSGSESVSRNGGGAHVAAAPPLGDPTSAGQPGESVTFSAPEAGTYRYTCPFPGHAEEGMEGRFVVRSA